MSDLLVISILLFILAFISIKTKSNNKGGCAGCHKNCAQCGIKTSFYDEYKRDQERLNK